MKRLALLAFIWGWSFLFIKVAVAGMTPPTVAFLRVLLGAAVLLVVLRVRGERLPGRATWSRFAVVAVFGNVVPFTLLAWGEERITSALTAVLNASTPLFTAAFVAIVLGDRIRRSQGVGLAIGLVGVAVAAGVGASDLAGSSLAGALASVGAGACYGLTFALMQKHFVTGFTPLAAAAGQLVAASALLAPLAAATTAIDGFDLSPTRVVAIVLLGAVGTGIAYVLNYGVIAEIGPTRASLVTYLVPVVAVLVGVVVLDEHFEWRMVAGGVLIVAGIAVVNGQIWRGLRTPVPTGLAVILLLVALPLAGCGGGSDTGCGPDRRESFDTASAQHVLPGSSEPTYLSDPPTSGPHQPTAVRGGVLDDELSRPEQVAVLEAGSILIQHRELGARDQADLEALATNDVVVAPNATLDHAVVATAWLFKQTCSTVDTTALNRFVTDHVGKGPGSD